jgi:hypothetical protein
MEKSPNHPGRLFRRGNDGLNLAVHVSAARELRLPLHTGIEEARQIFLIGRAGRVVKQSQ